MQLSFNFTLLALLAQGILALPGGNDNNQGGKTDIQGSNKQCKLDLILLAWALPAVKVKASSFCSTFIGSTVTSTISSTQINIVSATTTLPAVTNTVVIDGTTTLPQSTDLTTQFSTLQEIHTTFATLPVPDETSIKTITIQEQSTLYLKRAAPTKLPDFAAAFLSTQISSACSCIVTPPVSTITVSQVATSISTALETLSPTVQFTTSVTHTETTEPTTVVISILTTATETQIVTVPGSTNTVIATATVTEQLPVVTVQPPTRCNVRGAFSVPFRATIIDTLPYDETTTPHDCYLRCQANTNCKSFFYKYREPCNLSNALFQRNGYVSEDPNYFYTFNNRDCPNAAV